MSETYLNGKLSITSLAAPTAEDMGKLRELSDAERSAVIAEARSRGRDSPVGSRTPDEIWESALEKARATTTKPHHAL